MTNTGFSAMSSRRSGARWVGFILLMVLIIFNYVDRAALSVAMPVLGKEFDLDPFWIGIALSSFFWSYWLMQVPGGIIADRIGARATIGWSGVLWGLAETATAIASNAASLIGLRIFLGAAEAPIYPAAAKAMGSWFPQKERARAATMMDIGPAIGTAIGAPVVVFLIAGTGWRGAFLITGLVTIFIAFVVWSYLKNSPRESRWANEAETEYVEAELAHEDAENEEAREPVAVWKFMKYRSVMFLCLGLLGINTVFYGILTWIPQYLATERGFNLSSIGWALLVIFGFGAVGELTAGFLADFLRHRGMNPNLVLRSQIAFAALIILIAVIVLPNLSTAGTVITALSAVIFFARWYGLFWSLPATLAGRHNAGKLGSVMNFWANLAGVFISIAIGAIVQVTGSYALVFTVFGAAAIAFGIGGIGINWTKRLPLNKKVAASDELTRAA